LGKEIIHHHKGILIQLHHNLELIIRRQAEIMAENLGVLRVSAVDHLLGVPIAVIWEIQVQAADLVEVHLDLPIIRVAGQEEDKFASKIFLFIIYLLINEI